MAFSSKSPSRQTLIIAAVLVVLVWISTTFRPSSFAFTQNTKGVHPLISAQKGNTHPKFDVNADHPSTYRPPIGNPTGRPLTGPLAPGADDLDRPLILYAFADTPLARANLRFFLHAGLHAAADFVFILNGVDNATAPELGIPAGVDNVRTVLRNATCFDLGAHGEVLRDSANPAISGPGLPPVWRRYRRFILLNASIRGPFLPHWAGGSCWSDLYLHKVSATTKLVGMTANCWPRFHVEAMIWATDAAGMGLLIDPPAPRAEAGVNATRDEFGDEHDKVALGGCYAAWEKAVHAEIGATRVVRDAGFDVDLMMTAFRPRGDYMAQCNVTTAEDGDLLRNGRYFGTNVHPYEVLFQKTGRDIDPVLLDRLTEWHRAANTTSWEACGGFSPW